jgi:hypothetical protein
MMMLRSSILMRTENGVRSGATMISPNPAFRQYWRIKLTIRSASSGFVLIQSMPSTPKSPQKHTIAVGDARHQPTPVAGFANRSDVHQHYCISPIDRRCPFLALLRALAALLVWRCVALGQVELGFQSGLRFVITGITSTGWKHSEFKKHNILPDLLLSSHKVARCRRTASHLNLRSVQIHFRIYLFS